MGKEWSVLYRGNRWIGRRPCRWLPKGSGTFWVLTAKARYGMAFRPFKGICLVSAWSHYFGVGGSTPQLLRREEYPSMKQVKRSERAAVKHLAAMETEVFRDFLPLVEHCGMLQYEDGSPRKPGWFTVRTNGAAWVVSVKDPDSCSSFQTVGKTLDEAMGSAALLLGCEEAPWEHDSFLAQAEKRSSKK